MPLCPVRLDIDPIAIGSPWPVDLNLVEKHIRVSGSESDPLLDVYLVSAIEWAEGATHRSIVSREHRWVLRNFPQDAYQAIRLPRGKTQAVAGISYVSGGQTFTLTGPTSGSPAGTDYQEDLRGDDGGLLMPAQGGSWPSVDFDVPAPVTITFTAGWSTIPAEIQHAILFATTDAFDIRGTPDLAVQGRNLEARNALVSSWRLIRWY